MVTALVFTCEVALIAHIIVAYRRRKYTPVVCCEMVNAKPTVTNFVVWVQSPNVVFNSYIFTL
jgi:hypothetical protein